MTETAAETPVMPADPELLKLRVQEAWSNEARVTNYVAKVALREFADGPCRDAWRRTLQSVLPAGRRLRILDAGCGPGVFAQVCAELGHEVTGMDFSDRMILTAKGLAAARGIRCEFVHGDAEAPPFPPQSFDVVLSRRLLFNLPHPERAFAAWRDLVVPGGMVMSMDSDPSAAPEWMNAASRWLGHQLAKVTGYREPPQPYHIPQSVLHMTPDRFPLLRSPSDKVRPMMEQQGLNRIELVYTHEVNRIRHSMESLTERLLRPATRSYILIGYRA
jgi:ubiquinone/menaquinone biosynthesis C-methylase UbiE